MLKSISCLTECFPENREGIQSILLYWEPQFKIVTHFHLHIEAYYFLFYLFQLPSRMLKATYKNGIPLLIGPNRDFSNKSLKTILSMMRNLVFSKALI